MTDPTGYSFLSYRRTRSAEAEQLIASQRERGIPTWRDLDDLATEPTEDEIRRVLGDHQTANAVLWITPDTVESQMIRGVEVPSLTRRHEAQDNFFIVPVAAGGLDYSAAGAAVESDLNLVDLSRWNMLKAESNPASSDDINRVANHVLKQRLQAIHRSLPTAAPLQIALNTRQPARHQRGTALTIDWSHRFGGIQNREADAAEWQDRLLPALADISRAILETIPDRRLVCNGLSSLPAAVALGYQLMAPVGIKLSWEQTMPDQTTQIWSREAEREESGFTSSTQAVDLNATDLAVMVSINNDVSNAVAASREITGPFRARVHIRRNDSILSAQLNSPGQALDVAYRVIDAARTARYTYKINGKVHLFSAIPVGLAMLIGQLLNTLGPIQTYEHIPDTATGHYRPAAMLNMQR